MPTFPPPLVADIADGQCLPFIGAGFSRNARLPRGLDMPAWPGLTAALAGELDLAGAATVDGPTVAEAYEREYGRVALTEALRSALHDGQAQPGNAHHAFVEFAFDTVYTTNFDLLLEDAFAAAARPFRSLAAEEDLPFHGGRSTTTIVKMHGDFRHTQEIVVTTSDYAEYLGRRPILATHLGALLVTKTPLFIGYSLTDPDLLQIHEAVRSRLGRYLRLPYVVQFNVTPDQHQDGLKNGLYLFGPQSTDGETRDVTLARFLRQLHATVEAASLSAIRSEIPAAFEPLPQATVARTSGADDRVSLLTSTSAALVCIAPRTALADTTFRRLIEPAGTAVGLVPLRAEDIDSDVRAISERLRAAIEQARVVVADLGVEASPSVLYELGIARALGKPLVILAADAGVRLPTDLQGVRLLRYDQDDPSASVSVLAAELMRAGEDGALVSAERLLAEGQHRAAVAVLSVVLEQELRRLSRVRKTGPVLNFGDMVYGARQLGAIDDGVAKQVRAAVKLRNATVHGLSSPGRDKVEKMIELVRVLMALPEPPRRGANADEP